MKHYGTLETLKMSINSCGFTILESKIISYGFQVIMVGGAIINWYPRKGTLVFQGTEDQKEKLELAWGKL